MVSHAPKQTFLLLAHLVDRRLRVSPSFLEINRHLWAKHSVDSGPTDLPGILNGLWCSPNHDPTVWIHVALRAYDNYTI